MSSYGYATAERSGSTNSVYDYPEHLNPFYEDENHKRLRFWHFGGHRSDKPKSERRGSLVSIRDGLRDMWEFKTFRVKKKRSSSLGVTKTSESPPPLRRDDAEAHYNTISNASAYRATISHTQSNTTTPMFQRNTLYRSSLQDQQRENGIGLFRNDRYRSTIQNGFATYGGAGHNTMVTSTPRSRYNAATATTGRGMTAGVSQTSLKSTNPFDDEDALDDSVSLGGFSANGTIRSSMTRTRKKRRAPPPPPRMVNTSSNSDTSQLSTRLRIDETPPLEEDPKDVQELTNLTAEIESFVRTTSDDAVNVSSASNHETTTTSSSDANNNRVTNLVIVEEKDEVVSTETGATNEGATKKPQALSVTVTSSELPEPVEEISQAEELKIVEEPPPLPSPRAKPTPPPVPQTPPIAEEPDFENLALPETPVPARRLNKNRNQPPKHNGDSVLRIIESSDSTLKTPEEDQNMDSKAIKPINYEFEYKVEPIKTEIDAKIGSARLKISESTSDVNIPPNDGTERRRSVRDIIESINKSQSLLKVNHDSTSTLYSAQSTDSVNRNMRELNEREREIARLLQEMGSNLDEPVPQPTKKRGSYYDNVPDNGADENLDNLLSKSDLRVKKSPTKSLGIEGDDAGTFQDCIDWNPLPKPRRSRHFADPATVNQPSNGAATTVLTAVDRNGNNQS
ncbi:A-kinase anchor protein 200 [Culex quinquefasciatus]|uniref:A-kinase anchor protein 200 n=1 Tax=Culex quinquefasciatus TaxID=7176 RepID=UPI0018E36E13|nr:A-kinase anchor protein 200 [Culex quinquefasciatus]XP_038109705.1 A-kinase anchor protein 200 [Culex quinquefasciatus]XP_038109706.1 A-kinase anchor protein 200 [Culex quinquefasciatus]XP_038109707.1 A-kinase anchor protein 200 [Culex quinquefasciatus]